MPELPEVETVRRQLHARLANAVIVGVDIWRLGRLRPATGIDKHLMGQKVIAIERRAKLLIWRLEKGEALTAHLKMTGRFTFVEAGYQRAKHDRVRFIFRDKRGVIGYLVWADIRQFGYLALRSFAELIKICDLYGPEPLEIRPEVLATCLAIQSRRTIKAVLLDQKVIAGIGNIYADESCYRAGLRPTRRLSTLTEADRQRLAVCIQEVLRSSLKQRGTSAQNYIDTEGKRGGFLSLLQVYGRGGKPCKICKVSIKKIVLVQRGTHFCPSCQR